MLWICRAVKINLEDVHMVSIKMKVESKFCFINFQNIKNK